ncbi:mechanosensitive ion channel family protein [Vitiosangium sp. GDMCC 1.1324]|uniref:mechanosensitive ion channel family protein n=1 Tax=Vitiosangium sp. (strain GDMCC 1.1324) TaxID=2138576 RepID=UPI000D3D30B0|nr:mechanosensitive ion channel domain-containing protein [Vitiosangium sp. GDMCC 1.1324]PTL78460.1 mechanosensitive ion channel protein MscS [Vitiosangium sp. GDMCC 1.1324]
MSRALIGLCLLLSIVLPPRAWALNAGLGEPPSVVDRQTPYAAAKGFSDAVHRGDYGLAAHYLDLDFLPLAKQKEEGARLARRLKYVLDHKLPLGAIANLSREPEGDPENPRFDQVDALVVGDTLFPIRLARVHAGGEQVWVFSEATARAIDPLYAEYGPVVGELLPPVFFEKPVLGLELWQWLGLLVTLVGAGVLCVVLERLSLALLGRLASWTRVTWDDALVPAGQGPLRLLYFAVFGALGTTLLLLPPTARFLSTHLFTTLTIVSVAWFILRFLRLTSQFVQQSVTKQSKDAARARGLHTQLAVLRSVFEATTYIVATALLLMQFETVRNVGVSLLASAGIAGLVIGLAAQKSISSLLAGIQLSITQPIRIGDQVVVENEFGTVEEITLTYVVVRVWDERRLVIPIAQFLDKPFQNWSKGGQSMLGPVRLLVDFSTDMDALRMELRRILDNEGKDLWDGRVATVVVEDVLDRTMQVRVLVSTMPGTLFDLRCLVREKMMEYLRSRPLWLPTTRTESRAALQPPAGEQASPPPPGPPRA